MVVAALVAVAAFAIPGSPAQKKPTLGLDLQGGLEALKKATTSYEAYAPAHYQLGLVLRRLGQSDAARAYVGQERRLEEIRSGHPRPAAASERTAEPLAG